MHQFQRCSHHLRDLQRYYRFRGVDYTATIAMAIEPTAGTEITAHRRFPDR